MLNLVVIMGRLTADPELRTTSNGLSVTSFTVAVDRQYKSDNERQTDFISVVAWRGTADFVTRFFKKGQMIAVQGSLQVRNYEDKDGNKRTAYDVVADNVSFCGDKKPSQDEPQPQDEPQTKREPTPYDIEHNPDYVPEEFSVLPDANPFGDSEEGLPF